MYDPARPRRVMMPLASHQYHTTADAVSTVSQVPAKRDGGRSEGRRGIHISQASTSTSTVFRPVTGGRRAADVPRRSADSDRRRAASRGYIHSPQVTPYAAGHPSCSGGDTEQSLLSAERNPIGTQLD